MGLWSAIGGGDQPELLIIAETEAEARQAAGEYLETSPDVEAVSAADLPEGLWGWSPACRPGFIILGAGESARRQYQPGTGTDRSADLSDGFLRRRETEREAGG
jgi:hypothetical protein